MTTILPSFPRVPPSATESIDEKEKGSVRAASVKDIPPLGQPLDDNSDRIFQSTKNRPNDAIATQPSVFDDPLTLEIYRPPPQYENYHRFDPLARWTWREEKVRLLSIVVTTSSYVPCLSKAVVRKIDLRVMAWAFFMFASLDLDRSNISQANSDNLLGDLGMTTNDYNIGFMLFRLAFFW